MHDPANWFAMAVLASVTFVTILAVWRDCRRSGYPAGAYFGFRALWLVCKTWHGVRPRGPDPLPPTGPAILISNHTSTIDPLFLQCASRRVISFLMAREYYDIKLLQPIFNLNKPILVNRTGRDTAAMKATLRALGEGRIVGIFPEGGIHLDADSIGKAKPGTAMLALLTRVPVIPAFIERRPHTNNLWIGITRPANARVFFGPPINLSSYYDLELDNAVLETVTKLLMDNIARLRPGRVDSKS
jgi:1-acyl-sn-glycerol-3-phosphate acyltransferase